MKIKALVTTVLLLAPALASAQSTPEDFQALQRKQDIEGGYLHVLELPDGKKIEIRLIDPMAAQQPRILGTSIAGLDAKSRAVIQATIQRYLTDEDYKDLIDDKVAHLPDTEIRNQLEFLLSKLNSADAPLLKDVPKVPSKLDLGSDPQSVAADSAEAVTSILPQINGSKNGGSGKGTNSDRLQSTQTIQVPAPIDTSGTGKGQGKRRSRN